MKKFNYLMMAAAMTLGLASCSQETKPGTPVEDKTIVEGGVIIKEINVGGVKNSVKTGNYLFCKAIIVYNNSSKAATLSNFGIAFCSPQNGDGTNNNYDEDGKLTYEKEGYIPAQQGAWYYPGSITIEPFSDVVIALNGAIDHTAQEGGANSFDLSNADMACYDTSVFSLASYYPKPTNVPENMWLKGVKYNTATAWAISTISPALYLFSAPADITLSEYLTDENNLGYTNGYTTSAYKCAKIPMEWIVDGVELYNKDKVATSTKRLPESIDAGYCIYASASGYSAYRNIDEKATVNYGDNINKLVYNYADGVEGTTDPSGIDAAASAKNGAKIIYQDTNNSTADFHLRKGWSLK